MRGLTAAGRRCFFFLLFLFFPPVFPCPIAYVKAAIRPPPYAKGSFVKLLYFLPLEFDHALPLSPFRYHFLYCRVLRVSLMLNTTEARVLNAEWVVRLRYVFLSNITSRRACLFGTTVSEDCSVHSAQLVELKGAISAS